MSIERNFVSVNGLALGEETKGNTVQSIVRELDAHTVWRSGGWQGGHHVLHEDGREMAFSFFGAGTFEGARTYLRHMVLSPVELFREAEELELKGVENPLSLITIDQSCLSTTPYHCAMSRIREMLRGNQKKGTVGLGVGEALRDSVDPELAIRAGDFKYRDTCARKAEAIRRKKYQTAMDLITSQGVPVPKEVFLELEVLDDEELVGLFADACKYLAGMVEITDDEYLRKLLQREGSIVNEVTHGVLHHPRYGFVPHITQIIPTSHDVIQTVRNQGYEGSISRIGVTRTYMTRHGAGPLVSNSPELTQELPETHNNTANEWLGAFRVGHFDTVALNYALSIGKDIKGVDGIVISYLDVLSDKQEWRVCEAYEYTGKDEDVSDFFYIENGVIVGIKVHPDAGDDEHYKHQVKLTQLLKDCRPLLATLTPQDGMSMEDTFVAYVTTKLGVPVVGKAYGPKVSDRPLLPNFTEVIRVNR